MLHSMGFILYEIG